MHVRELTFVPIIAAALIGTASFTFASATPPPPPLAAGNLDFSSGCPFDVAGTARPYSPEIFRFVGSVDDVLVLINNKPDLKLLFNLGIADETPFITNAAFGPDVRIRLPRAGHYELQISAFDPVSRAAVTEQFRLSLDLQTAGRSATCDAGS